MKLGLHSHSHRCKSTAQLILVDVGISTKPVGKRHSVLIMTKLEDLKLICAKSTSHMWEILESKKHLITVLKQKILERLQLNHAALWFHVWKWVSQSNYSSLQFIFSSISLWWIRISRARRSLQRLTSQSPCINMTKAPWRPSSLLLTFSARQILLPSWIEVSIFPCNISIPTKSQYPTENSSISSKCHSLHPTYELFTHVDCPLEAIGTTWFTKVTLTH